MTNINTIKANSGISAFWLKAVVGILALTLFAYNYAKAQTFPAAQSLPYSLTTYSGTSFPTGWAAHHISGSIATKDVIPADGDQTRSATSFGWRDEAANGLSLMLDRNAPSGPTGAWLLSINTTNMSSVRLSWIYRLIATGSRDVNMGLQYRVGTSGNFTDLGGTAVEYYTASSPASQAHTISLPAPALNQAVVHIRFIYWQTTNANGTRPRISIDDIAVCGVSSSVAGPAQSICNSTTATLAGNTPTNGTGAWTVTAGTGSVTTPASPTSGVTGLSLGANTFRWTISNGSCSGSTPSFSDVTITRSADPTASNAGSPQTICATTATLAGNTPGVGSGLWTLQAGSGSITTPSSPTSGITGLGVGANTFRWTISSGACTPSFSDVTITRDASPTTSNAGSPQSVCVVTTATLAGNTAVVGTGAWTVEAGSGSVTTPSSPTSGVTGLSLGANTFRWTISNASCPPSFNDVTITRYADPTTSNAGSPQSVCAATATLAGNTAVDGTGAWTVQAGSGSVTTPSSPTSGVTGLSLGANTFRWTISNGSCTPSFSDVTITRNAVVVPSVSIVASSNPICPGVSVTFTATPTNGGSTPVYQWKVNNGNVGTDNFQYTTSALNPNDVVTCELTSNAVCASPTTATSSGLAVYSATLPFTTDLSTTSCWTIQHVGATPAGDWTFASSMSNPTLSPLVGTQMAYFNSNGFAAGASSRLVTPRLELNTMSEPYMRMKISRDSGFPNNKDLTEVHVSTDDGATWTVKPIRSPIRYGATFTTPGWFTFELDLTPFKGSSQVRVGLVAVGAAGNNIAIDEFAVLEASCAVPQNLTVTSITTTSAQVSWNPTAGNSNYRLRWTYYQDTSSYVQVYDSRNLVNNTSFTITGLLPNTFYTWQVSATCSGTSVGYQCYPDTFKTLAGNIPCAKPFGLSHVLNTGSSVTGHWDNRITADTFKIRYGKIGDSDFTYIRIPGSPGSVSSYTMNGLQANTSYYWQVSTVCAGVSSSYSAPDTFTTPIAYVSCTKLYGIYSDNVTPNTVDVGWDSLLIANEFRVRYWIDTLPIDFKYKTVSGGSPGNYTKVISLASLHPGNTYKFQIRSQCLGYKSGYSDEGTFVTPPAPARMAQDANVIENIFGDAEVFPNPGNGIFNIQLHSKVEAVLNYGLYDLSGRNLQNGQFQLNSGNNLQTVNFEGLAAGTYFLKLENNNYSRSTRIVIQ